MKVFPLKGELFGVFMNHYELLAIISGKYAEPEAVAILHTVEETVKKYASAFHYSQNLERKKLAYPIQHHSYGTYILMEFDCDATTLKTIDYEIRHMNELIRYTIVRREKVGAPKELERKEQKPFTTPGVHVPTPIITPLHSATREYVPTSPTPIMQAPLETSIPVPTVASMPIPMQAPTVEDKKEEKSILDLDAAISIPQEEPKTESEDNKKKQKKVTYEELDKKLDEILNNTIL